MASKRQRIQTELERIRRAHQGLLRPPDVVAFAADPETALHGRFEWDDAAAGYQYRLWQARSLIAVYVETTHPECQSVRAYVSLASDRSSPDGGYRRVVDVLRDADLRAELLEQAHGDMERFQDRYRHLKELADVMTAMRRHTRRGMVRRQRAKATA